MWNHSVVTLLKLAHTAKVGVAFTNLDAMLFQEAPEYIFWIPVHAWPTQDLVRFLNQPRVPVGMKVTRKFHPL